MTNFKNNKCYQEVLEESKSILILNKKWSQSYGELKDIVLEEKNTKNS